MLILIVFWVKSIKEKFFCKGCYFVLTENQHKAREKKRSITFLFFLLQGNRKIHLDKENGNWVEETWVSWRCRIFIKTIIYIKIFFFTIKVSCLFKFRCGHFLLVIFTHCGKNHILFIIANFAIPHFVSDASKENSLVYTVMTCRVCWIQKFISHTLTLDFWLCQCRL